MFPKRLVFNILLVCFLVLVASPLMAQDEAAEPTQEQTPPVVDEKVVKPEDRLVVVWTSGDRDVALKMVFMYTYNASGSRFGWWHDITLVVWGPSSKLLSEDTELQEYVAKMKEAGITLEACKACSDMYEVSAKLEALGVDVKYMGQQLTDYFKEGRHVVTF